MRLSKLRHVCDKGKEEVRRLSLLKNRPTELPIKPHPGPQTEALFCRADELFYGGRAGAGKSMLILMAAMNHRRSLIMRRTFPQLKDLIGKSRTLFSRLGSYNSQDKQWKLPGDRLVDFSSLQYDKDVENLQGNERSLIAFDEVTQFSRYQYLYPQGWNRSTFTDENGVPERCRIIATGNPPTRQAGRWVIEHWAPWLDPNYPGKKAEPGELRWFVVVGDESREVPGPDPVVIDGERVVPRSRTFIPGIMVPELQRTNYASVLMGLPELLRRALLKGEFVFDFGDDDLSVIPASWIRLSQARWDRSLTFASTQTAIGVDVARGGADRTVLACLYGRCFEELICYPGTETRTGDVVADKVRQVMRDRPLINVDVIGIGASPVDFLTKAKDGAGRSLRVQAINFSASATRLDKTGLLSFANLRSQLFWTVRELLDPTGSQVLTLPPDPELLEELSAFRWEYSASGHIQVESKKKVKERLGRSPDKADAIAIAVAPALKGDASWIEEC